MTTHSNYEFMNYDSWVNESFKWHWSCCNRRGNTWERQTERRQKDVIVRMTLTESPLLFNHSIWTLERRVKKEEKKGKHREEKETKCKLDLIQQTKEIFYLFASWLKRTLFQYAACVFVCQVLTSKFSNINLCKISVLVR